MKEQPIRKKQPIKKMLTPRKEGSGSLAMGTRSKVPSLPASPTANTRSKKKLDLG